MATRRASLEVEETLAVPGTDTASSKQHTQTNIPLNPVVMEQGAQVEEMDGNSLRDLPDEKQDQSCMKQFWDWLDAYQVQERHPDRVGLLVTFVVIPLAIAYCVVVAYQMMNAPDPVKTEVLWASSEGPFTMPVQCEAESGCLLSNTYGERNPECISLAYKDKLDVLLEYSDNFLDGPSVLGEAATVTTPIVSVLSEVWMAGHPKADEDGTVFKWTGVFQGTVSMTYVHTENKTLSNSGRDRDEYFNVQMNTDGTLMAGSTPCEGQHSADMRQVRIRIHPAITKIVVTPGFNWWTYFGVCSGQYAALLSWGALIVATYDTLKGN